MEGRALYQLKMAGRQVLLRVEPPEGSRKANLSEIQEQLHRRGVSYRHETLFDIYRRATGEFEPLAQRDAREYEVHVEVAPDGQRAWLTVVPPDVGQDELDPARIKEALEAARVEKGIRYDEIKRVLRDKVENQRVLVAEGRPKEDGTDGWLEFFHDPNEHAAIEENWADFRERNMIRNVTEGDLLVRVHYPVAGQDGFDVHARTLRAKPGKRAKIRLGRNVKVDESGTEVYALRDGYLVRMGDRISVEDVLDLNNVDGETGNVRFHGVVKVRGQVEDAFTVEAEKGIEVNGTVGKAVLTTKGDIKIGAGAFNTEIECDGSLHVRFLQEARVHAGGSVTADEYILHANVVAGTFVTVKAEPRGFITGGSVRAGTFIQAAVLGAAASEEPTVLEVGSGVDLRKSQEALEERMLTNLEVFQKTLKNLLYLQRQREQEGAIPDERRETYLRMVAGGSKLRDELQQQSRQYHRLRGTLSEGDPAPAAVLASQAIHPGVTLAVQRQKLVVRDPRDGGGFMIVDGAMKALPYGQVLKVQKQHQKREREQEQQAQRQQEQPPAGESAAGPRAAG